MSNDFDNERADHTGPLFDMPADSDSSTPAEEHDFDEISAVVQALEAEEPAPEPEPEPEPAPAIADAIAEVEALEPETPAFLTPEPAEKPGLFGGMFGRKGGRVEPEPVAPAASPEPASAEPTVNVVDMAGALAAVAALSAENAPRSRPSSPSRPQPQSLPEPQSLPQLWPPWCLASPSLRPPLSRSYSQSPHPSPSRARAARSSAACSAANTRTRPL